MNMASSSVSAWILLISVCTADGIFTYALNRCVFNSTELKDIEYIRSYYYNKLEFLRFSSNVGKYVGYTELGVKNAQRWNKDPAELSRMNAQKETVCQHNIGNWYKAILPKSGEFVSEFILTLNQTDQFIINNQ
ncbi:H-2 class II histocompatibility antigen, A beta chain-like [Stegastes partitus]|uniref:H-2 class II histocompatibility antigen, A beta chain-like n=1 Tax=Stegastes partitus TaxID=144197 RepID=A0A9Y4NJT8_9TELE|nr:PREDICTED: H-2 class II histocompatibility antigen, A beta chain-like [Stegastes partitus]